MTPEQQTHPTVAHLLRSAQAYCDQIAERETLQYGIAWHSKRFADLPEANQVREVVVENPSQLGDAFEEFESFYRDRGLSFHKWTPAGGMPSNDMSSFLLERGFVPVEHAAFALAEWVDVDVSQGIRIVPARAMRAALRRTLEMEYETTDPAVRALLLDARLERLDDPKLDEFVAMKGNEPVGHCALFEVGDIARVMGLFARDASGDRAVERALLAHILALAKRLVIRNICTLVEESADTDDDLLRAVGFQRVGSIVEFVRERGQMTVRDVAP
ncbi:MAG: hypothetical protein IIB61_06480 [Planctomycetes bacterium]|nr:hypothetical protein [Planctomycetota bacterium]